MQELLLNEATIYGINDINCPAEFNPPHQFEWGSNKMFYVYYLNAEDVIKYSIFIGGGDLIRAYHLVSLCALNDALIK